MPTKDDAMELSRIPNLFPGLDKPLAIVDIETTGGSAGRDRITEIGIVEVDADGVREWSTFINPQVPIPRTIQSLTGITDDMVADAPLFEEVAKDIITRLEGKTFVAHNVRFDYGFIRNAFASLGYPLKLELLCTVKLSRALYPEHKRHSLETLIDRFNIATDARHRALADARATYQFMCAAQKDKSPEDFMAAVQQQTRRPSLPPGLSATALDELPTCAGVYYFFGENDSLLYIGKSINIRKRVMSHFTGDKASEKAMAMCQQIRHIETQTTTGELSALLLESNEIKSKQPLYNRRLRRLSTLYTIQLREDPSGLLWPRVTKAQDASRGLKMYGLFPSVKKAKSALNDCAKSNGLCDHVLVNFGESNSKKSYADISHSPCMGKQLHRCRGLCTGEFNFLQHNVLLMEALGALALQAWPYDGPVALLENQITPDAATQYTVFLVDNWCVLQQHQGEGPITARGVQEMLKSTEAELPMLDRDLYRYLVKVVLQGAYGIEIIALTD
ncbi:exonuclease domain-containing protein [Gilvimarinus sp. SDUM040013]|uniref:DNA-directed DNA polymerase n=1 Tax=Gilvimarinus gilvus TaxID=3058038 RepID=A0ABU4RYJ3_9GAMM|nr:exonuclease domain-containing protein [Gilvimarinus sp. SDUM040013]MDO3385612.1 exonuclease domain-containing protein [Gilvimarinus sp. SDUM040013]MDX6849946.1 exonuclease domain-containing protein [Gilvimarinus sp. SDUM040013]